MKNIIRSFLGKKLERNPNKVIITVVQQSRPQENSLNSNDNIEEETLESERKSEEKIQQNSQENSLLITKEKYSYEKYYEDETEKSTLIKDETKNATETQGYLILQILKWYILSIIFVFNLFVERVYNSKQKKE